MSHPDREAAQDDGTTQADAQVDAGSEAAAAATTTPPTVRGAVGPADAGPDAGSEDEPEDGPEDPSASPRPVARPTPARTESGARYGVPGLPMNRSHPFYIGFMGAIGVLTAYWLLGLFGQLSSVLTLIVMALFLALGLEPVISALENRGFSRGISVGVVFVAVIAAFTGFGSAIAPALVTQAGELTTAAPELVTSFQNSSLVQRLDEQYGVIASVTAQVQERLANGDTAMQLFGGVYGAGAAVVSGAFSAFTVLVLTLYFAASLRSMTEAAYRIVPASRRPRVRLLADEIIRRIGGYIAGQVGVASLNGFFTFVGLTVLGLPYPVVLAIVVAMFGLIPLVGATIGAIVVIVVALFHSWQYAAIVAVYYLVYQQLENYVIAPKIMARTVAVPGAVAVIAALAGGTLLGVVGALIAIPVAAGILLIVQEVLIPRQAKS